MKNKRLYPYQEALTAPLAWWGTLSDFRCGTLYSLMGESKDAFNDVDRNMVRIEETPVNWNCDKGLRLEIPPHSVNVLVLT